MKRGAFTLATYPFDDVRIGCEACGREGRYRRSRLIERLGADTSMPDVLGRITADCPRRRAFSPPSCEAIYLDLARRSAGAR